MLTKDRLIGMYYVLPVLQRIKYTFAILVLVLIIDFASMVCFVNNSRLNIVVVAG